MGSVSSKDAGAAAGKWSSNNSTGRNSRSGDKAITASAQAQLQEERPREGAAFNPAVALPPSRTRLPGHTPLGADWHLCVSALLFLGLSFQPASAPTAARCWAGNQEAVEPL